MMMITIWNVLYYATAFGQLYITWDDEICEFSIPNVDINSYPSVLWCVTDEEASAG